MNSETPTALIVRHVPFEDAGSFASVLTACGFRLTEADAVADDLRAAGALQADLLVVMGGPVGVYEQEAYPFLAAEIELLRERLAARKRTLGICLGSQLMAQALGGEVHPGGAGKEIGWAPVTLTEAGRGNPLRHLDRVPVLHWHGDTFTLPPDAVLLASTAQYAHQAFAAGDHALALQFHPEVTAPGLERWYVGHACEISSVPGLTVPRLRRDSQTHAPALAPAAERCLREWLGMGTGSN